MLTEHILLVVSLSSNLLIIFKRVKVLWTPCLVCDCRPVDKAEIEGETETPSSNTSNSDKIRKALSKFYVQKNKNIDVEIKR